MAEICSNQSVKIFITCVLLRCHHFFISNLLTPAAIYFKLSITSIHLYFSGTVDGTNQLIIKGKFQQKHIENVLKRYISKGSF